MTPRARSYRKKEPATPPAPTTWNNRVHDGRYRAGAVYRDTKGTVKVVLSYRTFEGGQIVRGGVVYARPHRGTYQLGLRRFERDFRLA